MKAVYTQIPRPTLWLVRGDLAPVGETTPNAPPPFGAEVHSFYICKSPVANAHFSAFRPSFVPAETSPGPDQPAVNVTFDDALAYCRWYSDLSGKAFRLPTELEWEFACRGGTTGRYFFGNDPSAGGRYVWSEENAGGRAPEAETKESNPAGLHDMLGGVREWTSSLLSADPSSAEVPSSSALETKGLRVVRGGSFRTPIARMGSGVREGVLRTTRADDLGFRIVRRL